MTEAEWRDCTDPATMLEFLRGTASERKLRLFAVACCRRILDLLTDERSRNAVEVGERFANAEAAESDRFEASECAFEASGNQLVPYDASRAAWDCVHINAMSSAIGAADSASKAVGLKLPWPPDERVQRTWLTAWMSERHAQANLLRHLIGNPLRPVTIDPAWRTATVVALAQGIYDERAFDRLPILADALEDAGCDNVDILNHCRQPGEHVRGCWCVDSLLGKE